MNATMYLFVLVLVVFFMGNAVARKLLKKTHKKSVEFPDVSRKLLEKFETWDDRLGWCPNPNTQKTDKAKYTKGSEFNLITFDELGSRAPHEGVPGMGSVSCYGDSFCLAREVSDSETWAYYLGEKSGARVSNYGVGGYGIDQALLRCERQYEADPSDVVIMAVTAVSVARITSVYRHYLDPGNVLGVKPRFVLSEDGCLKLVPYPFHDKTCFINIQKYRKHFRSWDRHYHYWEKKAGKKWFVPSLFFVMKPSVIRDIIACVERSRYSLPAFVTCWAGNTKKKSRLSEPEHIKYVVKLWDYEADLFSAIVARFSDFVRSKGATPVLLLQHQAQWLSFDYGDGEPPWVDVMQTIQSGNPGLNVIDTWEWLKSCSFEADLYTAGTEGHHTAYANNLIADRLAEELSSWKKSH